MMHKYDHIFSSFMLSLSPDFFNRKYKQQTVIAEGKAVSIIHSFPDQNLQKQGNNINKPVLF